MPEATPLVVAIYNTHQAMCDMLSLILEAEGWCPVVANLAALHDDADAICALLIQHQAHVVIFDIAPPFTASTGRCSCRSAHAALYPTQRIF
jgi:hypothetical protein